MKRAKRVWNIISLGALMAFLAACHKDPTPAPQPNPDQPTDTITPNDTITPVVHHYPDTVYVPFELKPAIIEANPNMDTIKFYADKPDVKKIIMDLKPMESLYTSGWTWRAYHKARDTLQVRIDIAPDKVIGRGTIIVDRVIPDGIHNTYGLPRSDSIAFSQMGFDIYIPHKR